MMNKKIKKIRVMAFKHDSMLRFSWISFHSFSLMKKNLEWQEKNIFIFGIYMFVWIEKLVHKESIETINIWNLLKDTYVFVHKNLFGNVHTKLSTVILQRKKEFGIGRKEICIHTHTHTHLSLTVAHPTSEVKIRFFKPSQHLRPWLWISFLI